MYWMRHPEPFQTNFPAVASSRPYAITNQGPRVVALRLCIARSLQASMARLVLDGPSF